MNISTKSLLKNYLIGLSILTTALIANFFANAFGILTWYEFLQNPEKISFLNGLWLFLFYPLILGFPVLAFKKLNIL